MAKRAALAWGEALTEIGNSRALDDVFDLARSKFSERKLTDPCGTYRCFTNQLRRAGRLPAGRPRAHARGSERQPSVCHRGQRRRERPDNRCPCVSGPCRWWVKVKNPGYERLSLCPCSRSNRAIEETVTNQRRPVTSCPPPGYGHCSMDCSPLDSPSALPRLGCTKYSWGGWWSASAL